MRRTRQNTYSRIIGTTPRELLDPNPLRCAFLLTPIVADQSLNVLTAAVFNAAAGQAWLVPSGVTAVTDIYAWGSGGQGQCDGVANWGGGGGEFARSGALVVIPGTVYSISVDTQGLELSTFVKNPSAVTFLQAVSGTNASAIGATPGLGGAGGVGPVRFHGGDGDGGAPLGARGSGGGAAGHDAIGANSTGGAGGVGGGVATILGFGKGGNGVNAGTVGPPPALSHPGGGGAGSNNIAIPVSDGADGQVAIFYNLPATNPGLLSLSYRQDVSPGRGNLNYTSQTQWPTLITDEEIGEVIGDPWWAVSALAGLVVTVTEFLCEG